MDDAGIYRGLNEIFNDVFLRQDLALRPDMTAADIAGWDSLKQIEIVVACEERWRIKFSTRELDALSCVGDLAGIIRARAV